MQYQIGLIRLIALCLSLICIQSAVAKAPLSIDDAWARATFPLAPTGAIYMRVTNSSEKPVRLERASVVGSIASEAQIHNVIQDGEMMKMREQKGGVLIPAGETLAFAPGGYHIMLLGLKSGLEAGQQFTLTLYYGSGESVETQVLVQAVDGAALGHEHHH